MKFNESGQNFEAVHLENKLEEQAYLPINIDKNVLFKVLNNGTVRIEKNKMLLELLA
jgi:hypothetical protein